MRGVGWHVLRLCAWRGLACFEVLCLACLASSALCCCTRARRLWLQSVCPWPPHPTVPVADLLTQHAPCHSPAVAIGLEEGAFPLSNGNKLDDPYPPSVLVHFTADKNTDAVSCCAGCEALRRSWVGIALALA